MKLLTATAASQGLRNNDFTWAIEGELVWVQEACATDRDDPDGGCGCGRSFAGLSSHRATTTALVRDLPLSREDVTLALADYCESAGYGVHCADCLEQDVDDLLGMASWLETGTIVERRLDELRVRRFAARPR